MYIILNYTQDKYGCIYSHIKCYNSLENIRDDFNKKLKFGKRIWNTTINNYTYQTFDEFIVNDSVTFPFDLYRKYNDKRNTILYIPENKTIYLLKTNAFAHGCWDYPTTNDNDLEIYDDFNALYDTLNKLIQNNNYIEPFYDEDDYNDEDDSKQNDINQLNKLSSILSHYNEFKHTFGNDWFYSITIYKCDKCE